MFLTIIIPAYNVQKHIINTLESLKNQMTSNQDFEAIIVNDASTDQTQYIIDKFINNNRKMNIKLINLPINSGVSAARNVGIENANGEYIMFLDGDDYLADMYIQTINEKIRGNFTDIIFYGFNRVTEFKTILSNSFEKTTLPSEKLTGEQMLSKIIQKKVEFRLDSSIYKKSFIDEKQLEFTEGCHSGEDTEFIYKALCQAREVDFIDKILTNYVIRVGSITNSYNINRFQTIYARRRIKEFIRENGSSELINQINSIISDQIVRVYLHNYNDCINYLLESDYSYNNAILKLNADIEKKFPGLRIDMTEEFKRINPKDKKLKFKIKLFGKSPILYNRLLKLKNKKLND